MSDEENEEDEARRNVEEPEEDFQYKLVGVILHMGTADAGHYLSYINISRGVKDEETPEWLLTEKDTWLEFNDSSVRSFKFSNLEEDCFGGIAQNQVAGSSDFKDYSKNAYMVIYEKRRKDKIKVVVPQDF